MHEELDQLVDEIANRNSKLILLIGSPGLDKTALLNNLAARRKSTVLNVGASLGGRLLSIPHTRRPLQTSELLKETVDGCFGDEPALLNNIEILLDSTLQLDPLNLLKRLSHARRIVAAWPGEFKQDRLTYAATGHPEHRDYRISGVVLFQMQ